MADKLDPKELALLTAAVDGELSRAEKDRLRMLLAARKEAAALYQHLRNDAARIRKVPAAPPRSVANTVMARLPVVVVPHSRTLGSRSGRWLPVALAASVLFTTAMASYWFLDAEGHKAEAAAVREQLPAVPAHVAADVPDPESVAVAYAKPSVDLQSGIHKPAPQPNPVEIAKAPEVAPLPRSADGDVLGARIILPTLPLVGITARLNPIFDGQNLGALDVQNEILAQFKNDSAVRLDLFGKSAYDVFAKAAKQQGIALSVDARAQEQIARKVPFTLAVYTEALTPAEAAALLAEMGKNAGNGAVGRVHVIPASAVEAKETKDLFGADLQLLKAPAKPSAAVDPKKPISSDTLSRVTGAVAKAEKTAIALAYAPSANRTPPSQSKEIKDYLAKKGPRRPDTVALLFVFR